MSTLIKRFNNTGTSNLEAAKFNNLKPVRVVDVILDESHPEYIKYDGERAIGAIKYQVLDRTVNAEDPQTLPVAFPLYSHCKSLPLVNEIVLLVQATSHQASSARDSELTTYYTTTVNIWNSINSNPSPDTDADIVSPDLGYELKENTGVRSLHPYHGDVLLEGRHGQSIRLSGAKSFKNTLTTKDNAGKPFTIITNGHEPLDKGTTDFYVEDINKDLTSLYLVADHTVPLEQIRDKYAGATARPTLMNSYKGNQTILNTGRFAVNAKEDSILFSSQEDFGVTSKNIHLDGVDYVGIDAKKIYLGEDALRFELQPVILGDQLELLLNDLLNELKRIGTAMKNAKTVDAKPIPSLNVEGPVAEVIAKALLNRINPGGSSLLKSKKVFTE